MTDNKSSRIELRLSEKEKEIIQHKMKESSISNMSAYIRKMAINGMIIKLNISEITELVSLLRRYSNNINQIAKRVNATGAVFSNEIDEITESQNDIYRLLNDVLKKLSKLG